MLELAKDTSADFLSGVLLAVDVDGPVGTHVALHRRDGAIDVGYRLTLSDFTDQHLARLGESDYRRSSAGAFRVGDNGGLATF